MTRARRWKGNSLHDALFRRLIGAWRWRENGRGEGVDAGKPGAGVVVVWPHHVGQIRGGPNKHGQRLVHSGNDGNAVRTRWRGLFGAIAFRWVR